jgi:prolyl 3-hydroxylase /prolyl 3,4-dihydroxylase
MAPNEDNDDPAVYRSGSSRKTNEKVDSKAHANTDDDMDVEEDIDEEDEDGTLLTAQPGFNRLLIVLRDEGVMRFVKYVSAAAQGSRWDICGEYEVGMLEVDDEENDDE